MDIEAAYQKSLDYLYTFVDYSLTRSIRYSAQTFDIDRMRRFVAELGNPQQSYASIHIAGTKGKGSTAAFCASALQAGGYRVGLYTSPHLLDYCERIQINGQPITHAEFTALVDELRPMLEGEVKLTTFEITTALAFLYFARHGVDAAVIEVGLGGRLDATNVILPAVSVIASISYDHTHLLGETLGAIAAEKGGIIKPGVPVVLAPQQAEARQVLERIAEERGAPLVEVGRDYLYTRHSFSLEQGQNLRFWPPAKTGSEVSLRIPLLGYHQVENAATAYAALQTAAAHGLPIDEQAIREGFASVCWPGRFEVLQQNPALVIDSAHNRDSASKLRTALDDYFPDRPVILVFGASSDKDIEGMFSELMPRVSTFVATRSYHPRATEPEVLAELAEKFGRPARIVPTVEAALEEAMRMATADTLILAAGSVFIAAAVRETWLKWQASGQTPIPV